MWTSSATYSWAAENGEVSRNNEFYGQDIDLRCVRMTALNLAFRNPYGWIAWADALAVEQRLVCRTGFNGRGFISTGALEECPPSVRDAIGKEPDARNGSAGAVTQLVMF